jgi:hypothetical protein
LRSLWGNTRGSSSLLDRTISFDIKGKLPNKLIVPAFTRFAFICGAYGFAWHLRVRPNASYLFYVGNVPNGDAETTLLGK